jgi:hypothetical protein
LAHIKVRGSKAVRPTAEALWNARLDFFDFLMTPLTYPGQNRELAEGGKWIGWYRWTRIELALRTVPVSTAVPATVWPQQAVKVES